MIYFKLILGPNLNGECFINPEHIVAIRKHDDVSTRIYLSQSTDVYWLVKGDLQDVAEKVSLMK